MVASLLQRSQPLLVVSETVSSMTGEMGREMNSKSIYDCRTSYIAYVKDHTFVYELVLSPSVAAKGASAQQNLDI